MVRFNKAQSTTETGPFFGKLIPPINCTIQKSLQPLQTQFIKVLKVLFTYRHTESRLTAIGGALL